MKQTLSQALFLAETRQDPDLARAARCLDGLPIGDWPDTARALRQIAGSLPLKQEREYTVKDFIRGAYLFGETGPYRTRFAK